MNKFELNKTYTFTKKVGNYKYTYTLKPISLTRDNYLIGSVTQETYDVMRDYHYEPITRDYVVTKLTTRTAVQRTKDLVVEFTADMKD